MTVNLQEVRELWDEVDLSRNGSMDEERWGIAESLAKARREDGKTQADISAEVGRHQTTIGKWIEVSDREEEFEGLSFKEAIHIAKLSTNEVTDRFIAKQVLINADDDQMKELLSKLPSATRSQIKKLLKISPESRAW